MTTDTDPFYSGRWDKTASRRWHGREKAGRASGRILLFAVGAVIVFLYLFPVYWMYISGFKTSGEIFSRPPTFFPEAPTWDSFRWIFERENMGRYLANSFILAGSVTAITLVLGSGAAYGLAALRSRWADAVLLFVLISQVLPPALMATPMFVVFRQLGLINTMWAVILATTSKTLPFAIIMLRTTFLQIPHELEEAARSDGCTRFKAFFLIVLPVAKVGILVTGILAFIQAYGEFIYALALLTKKNWQPATVGLYGFVGAEYADWNNVMAFASVFVTPVILLFALLQRRIVSGLTAGSVK